MQARSSIFIFCLSLFALLAPKNNCSAQIQTEPTQQIYLAIPDDWITNHDRSILMRYYPTQHAYQFQFQLKTQSPRFRNDQVQIETFNMRYPYGRYDRAEIDFFDQFYLTGNVYSHKSGNTAITGEHRYYFYKVESNQKISGQTIKLLPMLESSVFSSGKFNRSSPQVQSKVTPLMLGGEVALKPGKNKNDTLIKLRLNVGPGMLMQNLNVQKYYPALNSGILVTF